MLRYIRYLERQELAKHSCMITNNKCKFSNNTQGVMHHRKCDLPSLHHLDERHLTRKDAQASLHILGRQFDGSTIQGKKRERSNATMTKSGSRKLPSLMPRKIMISNCYLQLTTDTHMHWWCQSRAANDNNNSSKECTKPDHDN